MSKSKLCFSLNMDEGVRGSIERLLGIQQTDQLGDYLGVPLLHTRTKNSTFQFIVDKDQRKLNGYDSKLLSLAGRTMLAKSILMTILGYFMQTAMLSIAIFERIEQIVKRFVWIGSNEVNKKALVNWETVCQLMLKGGFGLKRLVPQNMSYLMKLAYQLVTRHDTLWVRLLHSKYKIHEVCSEAIDRPMCSYV